MRDVAASPRKPSCVRVVAAILASMPFACLALPRASTDGSFNLLGLVAVILAIIAAGALIALRAERGRLSRLRSYIEAMAAQVLHHDPSDENDFAVQEDAPPAILALKACVDVAIARTQRALTTQGQFLETASHELRTPLAAMRAQAQLGLGSDSADEMRTALTNVTQDLDRACRLVEQLLDLARVGGSIFDEPKRVVSLAPVVDAVLQDFDRQARMKEISLTTDFQAHEVRVRELDLEVVMRNLVSNSIQYSAPGSQVLLSARPHGGGILITVDDAGPGIPADRVEDALLPFNRLGESDGAGVGLGLAIVKRIVDLHGATIRLRRAPLGGLRVELWFGG